MPRTKSQFPLPKQRAEYLENPSHCPFCGDDQTMHYTDTHPQPVEGSGGREVSWHVACDCGHSWDEVYTLSHCVFDGAGQ